MWDDHVLSLGFSNSNLSTAWLGLQGVGCGLVTLLQTNADFVPGSHSTL